jgi:hypothetical protein
VEWKWRLGMMTAELGKSQRANRDEAVWPANHLPLPVCLLVCKWLKLEGVASSRTDEQGSAVFPTRKPSVEEKQC